MIFPFSLHNRLKIRWTMAVFPLFLRARIGESVEIAYLADWPLGNVPVRACHGMLFTLFISIAGPMIYVGLLFWKYPDFSKYMKDQLKRIHSV